MSGLNYVPDGDWSSVRQNFEALARLLLDSGGRVLVIRFGALVLSWPGAASTSNVATVSHGMARTPTAVVATAGGSPGLNFTPVLSTQNFGATTFTVSATTVDAQNPLNTATTFISWIATG